MINFKLNNNKGFDIKFNIVQNVDLDTDDTNIKLLTSIPSRRLSNLYKEICCVKKSIRMKTENGILKFSTTLIDVAETWTSFDLDKDFNQKIDITVKSEFFKLLSKLSIFNNDTELLFDSVNKTVIVRNTIIPKTLLKRSIFPLGYVEIKINHD